MSYRFWLKVAAVLELLTAAIHSLSFFVQQTPNNETERQLISLVQGYKADLGFGFHRTISDLMNGLSMCFTLLYVLGGVLLFYLLRSKVEDSVIKGVTNIYLIVFGFAFVWMVIFTFLPPIVLTGIVFILLAAARSIGFRTRAVE